MFGIHDFGLFIAAGLLLNVTPGPDNAFIIGRSVQMGWRGGAAAALGISAGCLVHIFGAALGLSALLAASATAFNVVSMRAQRTFSTQASAWCSPSPRMKRRSQPSRRPRCGRCSGRAR